MSKICCVTSCPNPPVQTLTYSNLATTASSLIGFPSVDSSKIIYAKGVEHLPVCSTHLSSLSSKMQSRD